MVIYILLTVLFLFLLISTHIPTCKIRRYELIMLMCTTACKNYTTQLS